jgi:hypothetical protein
MPASKKKKAAKTSSMVESKVTKMSEQMSMLLFVFSFAMMMFAFVLYKVYAQ